MKKFIFRNIMDIINIMINLYQYKLVVYFLDRHVQFRWSQDNAGTSIDFINVY